jgi:hypothetical protein
MASAGAGFSRQIVVHEVCATNLAPDIRTVAAGSCAKSLGWPALQSFLRRGPGAAAGNQARTASRSVTCRRRCML